MKALKVLDLYWIHPVYEIVYLCIQGIFVLLNIISKPRKWRRWTDNLTEKGKRDLKLINRALEDGDSKAYNELMKLYRDPLYFMLYEKVGDQELAKDLTIESLGKAFKKLHLYTSSYAFSTWLYTVARNSLY